VVLFRPTSMWSQYRGTIIATLVVLLLQLGLIVTLLVERQQRRRAERRARDRGIELAHASRLATVGELTASIAHQINQPLGAILSNADAAEMLLDTTPPPLDEVRQILADIRRDDERAHGVVQGMRALLRRRAFEVQPLDLNEAIAQVVHLLDGEARRLGVTLRTDLAAGLPEVRGDRVHLQQVILNLVMNGIDAAGEGEAAERRVAVRSAASAAGDVEVSVSDTGPGIPPSQLHHIFESFVTTKQDGLGLGLSIARSLVELHGGSIGAENGPHAGATVRFVLPGTARTT
jgi:signal transduction histidine kinase